MSATRKYYLPSEGTIDEFANLQPTSMAQVQPQYSKADEVEWSTALLDCFEDAPTCCYGFWCAPCLACTVSGRLQEHYCLPLCDFCTTSACTLCGIPFSVPPAAYGLRVAMRNRYKIKGSLLKDMCVSCCCAWCSWCQMHRELKLKNKPPNIINIQNVVAMQPGPMAAQAMNQAVTTN